MPSLSEVWDMALPVQVPKKTQMSPLGFVTLVSWVGEKSQDTTPVTSLPFLKTYPHFD